MQPLKPIFKTHLLMQTPFALNLANNLATQFNQITGLNLSHCFYNHNDNLYFCANPSQLVLALIKMHQKQITTPYYLSIAPQIDNTFPHIYLEPQSNYSPEDLSDQTPMPLNLGLSFPISIINI